MSRQAITLVVLSLVLAACVAPGARDETTNMPVPVAPGPAVTEGIDIYMQQRMQVESVGFRLRKAAADACERQDLARRDIGVVVWSLANFPNPVDRTRLERLYGLTDAVTVALAVTGGPGRSAGLRPGAIITHVDGIELPSGQGATARFISITNEAARRGSFSVRLASGREHVIHPEQVCASPVLLVRSPDMNAATDGNAVAMTTALHGLLRSDDEIAVILGHELAHIILGHTRPGAAAGPSRETEADRAGLELAARAGFDITAAPALWKRLNSSRVAASLASTHPTGPEREAAIRKAVEEIRQARP